MRTKTSKISLTAFAFLASVVLFQNCGGKFASTKSGSQSTVSSSETPSGADPGTSPTPGVTPAPGVTPPPGVTPAPATPLPASACGIQGATSTLAFCEKFDKPAAIFTRSGQLDPQLWSVSRLGNASLNLGAPFAIPTTQIDLCGTVQTVNAPNDVQICNGQLREASNDGGALSSRNLSPRQPFDFSGRTGTIAFDVTNDTAGTHAAYPVLWVTEQPVAAPFSHFGSLPSHPTNGFAVRFGAATQLNGAGYGCPTADGLQFSVDSAIVVRNYLFEDLLVGGFNQCNSLGGGPNSCVQTGMTVKLLNCVKQASGPNGGMNHIEIKVSQNQIDVYATDAGTTAPLKHIAVIEKADLKFSRGFIYLSDVHYNADKGDPDRPSQRIHTYAWDNVGFDGPVLARNRQFDVMDSRVAVAGGQNLGWSTSPASPGNVNTPEIPAADLVMAKSASLQFNFFTYDPPNVFTYQLNDGVKRTMAWPFPDRVGYTVRTISLPVPVTDLKMGANKITINSDVAMEIVNVGITLDGAGGIVSPK